jgi:acyl carrier protein/NAD(P)-dependent dehydrogenase (short-subunit alcohol dehydrogenase family)
LLLGRSGPKDEEAAGKIEALRSGGVTVAIAAVDVSDAVKLRACLKKHRTAMPPLRGVVHAAAVLDDGLIASLTPERIHNALAAKSLGAWNLHEATLDCPLDFFVLYSSATTAFGNPGQSGYVAANSMLETLADWRRRRKLPAQVIGWGPIGDTGMLARNEKARQVLHAVLGVGAMTSSEALDWLEHCLALDIGASHFFGLDWRNRSGRREKALASPRFARLCPSRTAAAPSQDAPLEYLRSCSPQEGIPLVASLLMDEISAVLRLPKDKFTADTPLAALGMDSLMGMELSLAVEQKFALTDYTLPLSEETSAQSLANAIYAHIAGDRDADGEDAGSGIDRQTLLALERKHKVRLPDEERDALLKTLR